MPRAAPPKRARDQAPVTRFQPYRRCALRPPRFSHFLDLPGELRRQIYAHVLLVPDAAIDVGAIWNEPPKLGVALLRTCRQVHDEAAHFLYSANTFCFLEQCDAFSVDGDDVDENPCFKWLRTIGAANALSIRNLQLRLRDERLADYYAACLGRISTCAGRLARLALVAEKHASRRLLLRPGHFISRWEPNRVCPLSECRLAELGTAIRRFDLKVLVLAGRHDRATMDRICSLVMCRVQAVDGELAKRDAARCALLWDRKTCYDGFLAGGKGSNRIYRIEDVDAGLVDADVDPEAEAEDITEEEGDEWGDASDSGIIP